MMIGKNLQHLRRINKMTQEQLADKMSVSRQTISRWESDEVTPELSKLIEIGNFFSCKLDELVTRDLSARDEIYSTVSLRKIPAFRMARYVMISPDPETDVQNYMQNWAKYSGLLAADPSARLIGWDFPFVSQEQKVRFGLHGYVAAWILPEAFKTTCPGVEYAENKEAVYAVITVTAPMAQPFERIPDGYKRIMEYLQVNNFREKQDENMISCFEYEYEKDGTHCMDIFVCTDAVIKTEACSHFGF